MNGSSIYAAGCCVAAGVVGAPAGYVLSSTDNVEVRLVDVCGPGGADIGINLQPTPAINGGTIGGVANNANICEGIAIGNFTNVADASGGTVGLTYGGAFTYDWELSTDGGSTFNPVGVATTTWNSPTLVTVGSTYVIRRKATDRCGNFGYSNTISVVGRPTPNASMSPVSQTICPGTSTTINVTLSPGTGPFDIIYSDGVITTPVTGLNSGDAITVSPILNPTIYSFTSLTDVYGCNRASGFTGGASVTIVQLLLIVQ